MKAKDLEKLCGKWPGVTFDVKWGADFVASVANKWVLVENSRKHPKQWLEQNIRTSYELVRDKLPKKVREQLSG